MSGRKSAAGSVRAGGIGWAWAVAAAAAAAGVLALAGAVDAEAQSRPATIEINHVDADTVTIATNGMYSGQSSYQRQTLDPSGNTMSAGTTSSLMVNSINTSTNIDLSANGVYTVQVDTIGSAGGTQWDRPNTVTMVFEHPSNDHAGTYVGSVTANNPDAATITTGQTHTIDALGSSVFAPTSLSSLAEVRVTGEPDQGTAVVQSDKSILYTPGTGASAAGTFNIRYEVSVGASLPGRDEATVAVTVEQPNVDPTIAALLDLERTVGQLVSVTPSANDDNGDTLTFTLGGDDLPNRNFNTGTGALTWMPTAAGTYAVTITVSDGRGGATPSASFTITVTEPPVAAFPSPTASYTVTDPGSRLIEINDNSEHRRTVTLPAGLDQPVSGVSVHLDVRHAMAQDVSATLISPDGTMAAITDGSGAAGPFVPTTYTSDETATLAALVGQAMPGDWVLVVRDQNANGVTGEFSEWGLTLEYEPAVPSGQQATIAVSHDGPHDVTVQTAGAYGAQYDMRIVAPDGSLIKDVRGLVDGDYTLTAAQLPATGTYAVQTDLPAASPKWASPTTVTATFEHAGDETDTHTASYGAAPNWPPRLDYTGNLVVTAGETLEFQASATDLNGDVATWGIGPTPPGADYNRRAGTITWTPDPGLAGNSYPVTVNAVDGRDANIGDIERIWISVQDAADAAMPNDNRPAFDPLPAELVYAMGSDATFNANAADGDGDDLTYAIFSHDSGSATISPDNGTLTFVTDRTREYTMVIGVTDGRGKSDIAEIDVRVIAADAVQAVDDHVSSDLSADSMPIDVTANDLPAGVVLRGIQAPEFDHISTRLLLDTLPPVPIPEPVQVDVPGKTSYVTKDGAYVTKVGNFTLVNGTIVYDPTEAVAFLPPGVATVSIPYGLHNGTAAMLPDEDGNLVGGFDASAATLYLTLGARQPVSAEADTVTTEHGTDVAIAVLANDMYSQSDIVNPYVDVHRHPRNGVAVPAGPGILYFPDDCYLGTDAFSYTLVDASSRDSVASVSVGVAAASFGVKVPTGGPTVINPFGQRHDASCDGLEVTATAPSTGTVAVDAGGRITYEPNVGATGTGTIQYSAVSGGQAYPGAITVEHHAPVSVDATDLYRVASGDIMEQIGTTNADDVELMWSLHSDEVGVSPWASRVGGSELATISPDGRFEWNTPPTGGRDAPYEFTVYATVVNGTQELSAPLRVGVSASVNAPVLGAYDDMATTESGQPVTFDLLENDFVKPDSIADAVAIQIQGSGGTTALNGGNITYTPAAGFAGVDTFTYTLSHSGVTSEATVTVAVTNEAPVLTTIGNQQATAGLQSAVFDAEATDADGDPLTFDIEWVSGPAGVTLPPANADFGADTGILTWAPQVAGTYTVTVSVSDVAQSVSETLTITVSPAANQAPRITSAIGPLTATVNQALEGFDVDATDDDGPDADIRFSINWGTGGQPAGASFDDMTGVLTWTPQAAGTHTFTVTATDGTDTSAPLAVTITVSAAGTAPTNSAPVITAIPNESVFIGETLTVQAAATDPDSGDTVTFVLDRGTSPALPMTAAFDEAAGLLTWTPLGNETGEYSVGITATDGSLEDAAPFTITVPNRDPVLAPIGNLIVFVGTPVPLDADATDEDSGQTLTYSATGLPAGVQIDGMTGALTWIPGDGEMGEYAVTVTVSDGRGGTDSEALTINVIAPADFLRTDNATTINAGISGADPGETLTFEGGTYENVTEPIVVQRNNVTLESVMGETAVLPGMAAIHVDGTDVEISGIEFAGAEAVRVSSGSGLTLKGNTMTAGGVTVCDGDCSVPADGEVSSLIIIRDNSFEGSGTAINNTAQGTLNAPRNYFGPDGPEAQDRIAGEVNFEPWYTDAAREMLMVEFREGHDDLDMSGPCKLRTLEPAVFTGAAWRSAGGMGVQTVATTGLPIASITLTATGPWTDGTDTYPDARTQAWIGSETRVDVTAGTPVELVIPADQQLMDTLDINLSLDLTAYSTGGEVDLDLPITYTATCG